MAENIEHLTLARSRLAENDGDEHGDRSDHGPPGDMPPATTHSSAREPGGLQRRTNPDIVIGDTDRHTTTLNWPLRGIETHNSRVVNNNEASALDRCRVGAISSNYAAGSQSATAGGWGFDCYGLQSAAADADVVTKVRADRAQRENSVQVPPGEDGSTWAFGNAHKSRKGSSNQPRNWREESVQTSTKANPPDPWSRGRGLTPLVNGVKTVTMYAHHDGNDDDENDDDDDYLHELVMTNQEDLDVISTLWVLENIAAMLREFLENLLVIMDA